MTTSSVPTASEIPQHLKNTIVRVLNSNGVSKATIAAASVGIAVVELSRTHQDIVIDEGQPFAETFSWLGHRSEINNLIVQNLDQYAEVVKDVYHEYAQEQVENFVQDLAEELFGPGIELESWSVAQISSDNPTPIVVSGGNNNLTEEATTATPGVVAPATEEHNPETCELCRQAPSKTDKALAYPTAQATTIAPGAIQPAEFLDVEAQADSVVPPRLLTGCGENS